MGEQLIYTYRGHCSNAPTGEGNLYTDQYGNWWVDDSLGNMKRCDSRISCGAFRLQSDVESKSERRPWPPNRKRARMDGKAVRP